MVYCYLVAFTAWLSRLLSYDRDRIVCDRALTQFSYRFRTVNKLGSKKQTIVYSIRSQSIFYYYRYKYTYSYISLILPHIGYLSQFYRILSFLLFCLLYSRLQVSDLLHIGIGINRF